MRVLFLQKRLLFPVDSGWRVRTLNVLRHLARWHEVTYVCNVQERDRAHLSAMAGLGMRLETEPWDEAPRHGVRFYRDLALNLASPRPFTVDKDFDPALRRRVARLLVESRFDVVVCDFVQMARNVLELALPPSVLFQHNVEAQVLGRLADVPGHPVRAAYMRWQALKMRRFESAACRAFTRVVAVSPQDQRTFETLYHLTNVRTIDTAVDTEYFVPLPRSGRQPRLVFVGSLDWLPNEDGLLEFMRATWPIIRQQRGDVTLDIVGRHPSPAVRRLGAIDGVRLEANVPDVRPYLAAGAISIVPLRIGCGTRLKVFESMAMGIPVVSTTIGAEGLPVESGTHLLVADTPDTFAAAVIRLLATPGEGEQMASRARSLVESRFSSEVVARQFEAVCLEAAQVAA